jgi:hypothetical protein
LIYCDAVKINDSINKLYQNINMGSENKIKEEKSNHKYLLKFTNVYAIQNDYKYRNLKVNKKLYNYF